MKRIVLGAFVVSLILVAIPILTPEPVSAMTGSGTSEDPYMIYNVTDLQDMHDDLDAYYELANDIDASATETWNWDAGRGVYEGFIPICGFGGDFDGNFYTISNLYMNWKDTYSCVGLFCSLDSGAVIENLCVSGNVSNDYGSESSSGCAAILVGCIAYESSIVIRQCITYGVVDNKFSDTGGVGSVRGCAGGFVGYILSSSILIEKCATEADVTMWANSEANPEVGGFIGTSFSSSATIRNCYAMGDAIVTGGSSSKSGGFCGYILSGTVDNCYSIGSPGGGSSNGGFCGSGSCSDCFWDKETSNENTSSCGTGGTTVEMQTESTFTSAGWDFDTVWDIEDTLNYGYPYLLWWYDPYIFPSDFTQVVWFQPNAIIEGTELPNRAGYEDGIITWGANPDGIDITYGSLIPEEEYNFEPITPGSDDIIRPRPPLPTTDVDTTGLMSNPLYPLVSILAGVSGWTERLVWLLFAWLIVIIAMLGVHLGFDTRKETEKPHHFVLTSITGLGLSIVFYTMGIFPLWVIILMAFGLVGAIIWERQPVM